ATDKAFQDILMTLRAMASNDDRIIDYFRSISQGKRPTKSDSIVDFEVLDSVKIRLDDFIENVETQVWHRLAKISWRPFEEAREFVRSLKLNNHDEWCRFSKTAKRPADIPSNPQSVYKGSGWQGMGDWLGTGTIALRLREYLRFEDAREFARSLNLNGVMEWRAFTKTDEMPENIPTDPSSSYKDKGWKGMKDFLGTEKVWRPFEEAREFAQKLNLKGSSEWRQYAKSGDLPSDIPAYPDKTYKDKGWAGWGDYLGTGNVANFLKEYRPFEEAREFAQSLKLSSQKEWQAFIKTSKMPEDIPADPRGSYQNKGWKGFGDWLGTGRVADQFKKYRPFEEAREFARSSNLRSQKEWRAFTKTGEMPEDIPAKPDNTYRGKGWKGFGDWLGTGRVADQFKKYRPFEEAREFARSLNLRSQKEWVAFTKTGEMPEDVPSCPYNTYKDKGWKGMGDWLGTG
ncbi:hypothetical protein N9I65_02650, partial [bacterium]|nr:hypothetical protein [bacterium]